MIWNGFLLPIHVPGTRLVVRIYKWFNSDIAAGSDNSPLLMIVSDLGADLENQTNGTIVPTQSSSEWNAPWWHPYTSSLCRVGVASLPQLRSSCVPQGLLSSLPQEKCSHSFFQLCLLTCGSGSWRPCNLSFKLTVELDIWLWPAPDIGHGGLVQSWGSLLGEALTGLLPMTRRGILTRTESTA